MQQLCSGECGQTKDDGNHQDGFGCPRDFSASGFPGDKAGKNSAADDRVDQLSKQTRQRMRCICRAAAWAELSSVYIYQLNLGLLPGDEGLILAREAVNQALTIDPDYALAHASLGWIAMTYDNDLAAAARHIERALQLEPSNPRILRNTATLDASSGRWDEAIASYRTALALSPGLSGGQFGIGMALLLKGEPQAALEAMQSEDAIWGMIGLPLAYHALGRKDESDAALATVPGEYWQVARAISRDRIQCNA